MMALMATYQQEVGIVQRTKFNQVFETRNYYRLCIEDTIVGLCRVESQCPEMPSESWLFQERQDLLVTNQDGVNGRLLEYAASVV